MFRLILKYIYFDPKKRFVKRSKQAQFQSPILHSLKSIIYSTLSDQPIEKEKEEVKLTSDLHNRPPY